MPYLRILADARCRLSVDGQNRGILTPGDVASFNVPLGQHYVSAICEYTSTLKQNRIVDVQYDNYLVINFSEMIKRNQDLLNDLELFRFYQGDKCGFFDPITRSIIVSPQFNKCSLFSEAGYSIVSSNGKNGVINKQGKLVLSCIYDEIHDDSGLFRVNDNGQYSVINKNGKTVIGPVPCKIEVYKINKTIFYTYKRDSHVYIFDDAGHLVFDGEYDRVSIERKLGRFYFLASKDSVESVFDSDRKCIIAPIYDTIYVGDYYFVVISEKGGIKKEGAYDLKGNVIIPVEYDSVYDEGNGVFLIRKDEYAQIVYFNGKSVIQTGFEDGSVYDNRFVVLSSNNSVKAFLDLQSGFIRRFDRDYERMERLTGHGADDYGFYKVTRNGKYGLLGAAPAFNQIVECKYEKIEEFVNGYALVQMDGRTGAIDRFGKEVIPCDYYNYFVFSKDGYACVYNRYWKYGIINAQNQDVLGFAGYDKMEWWSDYSREKNPLVVAAKDNKWVLIDFQNRIQGQTYDHISYQTNSKGSYYQVFKKVGGLLRYGCVNVRGEEFIPCKYDIITDAKDGRFWCRIADNYALFDDKGNQLTDFEFKEVNVFHDGYASVKNIYGWGIIDASGKKITSMFYSFVDEFFRDHQYGDINIFEYDLDEDGEPYASLDAEVEGIFRYGIASLNEVNGGRESIFVDTSGNKIILRQLGEPLV